MIEIIAGKDKTYKKGKIKVSWANGEDYKKDDYSSIYLYKNNEKKATMYIDNAEDIGVANKLLTMYGFKIVEPIDWHAIEVDTPIYVRDDENQGWKIAHFAQYDSDINWIYVWDRGKTSHTAKDYEQVGYRYAKLRSS